MSPRRLIAAGGRRILDAALVSVAAMLAAAALLTLRLSGLEQVVNPRSVAAIGTIVVGAGIASFCWRLALPSLAPRLPGSVRLFASVLALTAAIAGASALLFSVVDFDLAQIEVVNHGSLLKRVVHHLASGYLMLLAGWPLLFPWPLPVLALGLSLWSLPGRNMPGPPATAEPIEVAPSERVALALRRDR